MAFDMSNVATFGYYSCVLPPTEEFPWDGIRKFLHDGQRIARVLNGIETLRTISTDSIECTNVTDRHTERRTNRHTTDGLAYT